MAAPGKARQPRRDRRSCGGSRARAWAVTGDYLEAEPFCAHVPKKYRRMVEAGEAEPVEEYFAHRRAWAGQPLPVHSSVTCGSSDPAGGCG